MSCLLCFSNTLPMIQIFSKRGKDINICKIISKHFWLKPNSKKPSEQNICSNCWRIVKEFHELYLRALNTHFEDDVFVEQSIIKQSFDEEDFEDDVSTEQSIINQSFNKHDAKNLIKENTEKFLTLDEIKVETDDFKSLPQVEVIESLIPLYPQNNTNCNIGINNDDCTANIIESTSNHSQDSFQDYFTKNVGNNSHEYFDYVDKSSKMCDICGAVLKHMEGLKNHKIAVHNNTEYKCRYCKRISPNAIALKRHMNRKHLTELGNNCKICLKSFPSERSLKVHLRQHALPNNGRESNLVMLID